MSNGLGFNTYAARYMSKVVDDGGTFPSQLVQQAFERLAVDMFIMLGDFRAVWPFYGGNQESHSRELFCRYDISSWGDDSATHNANGVTVGGGGGGFGISQLFPSTVLTPSNWTFGLYSRTLLNSDTAYDVGAFNTSAPMRINCRNAAGSMAYQAGNNTARTAVATNSQGLFYLHRGSSTTGVAVRNATIIGSSFGTCTSTPNQQWGTAGVTSGDGVSARNTAFSFVGKTILLGNYTNFYNAVQAFQVVLGRQV